MTSNQVVNSYSPSAACMRQGIASILVHIMVCRIFGTIPLSKPMPDYCQLNTWTLRNKLQRNFNKNTKVFIYENASEIIVCEIAAILSWGEELKYPCDQLEKSHWNTNYTVTTEHVSWQINNINISSSHFTFSCLIARKKAFCILFFKFDSVTAFKLITFLIFTTLRPNTSPKISLDSTEKYNKTTDRYMNEKNISIYLASGLENFPLIWIASISSTSLTSFWHKRHGVFSSCSTVCYARHPG